MAISIFKQPPAYVLIDENQGCYKQPQTIESVMEALRLGPFVARAAIGPGAYSHPPFPLSDPELGFTVHDWPSGSFRKEHPLPVLVIICGASQSKEAAHVYFVLARDMTGDPNTPLRKIYASDRDRKVYMTAIETFRDGVSDVFPPKAPPT